MAETKIVPVVMTGLADLINDLPTGDWYLMRVMLRKGSAGPEVHPLKFVTRPDVYEEDGKLWYRDEHDELHLME